MAILLVHRRREAIETSEAVLIDYPSNALMGMLVEDLVVGSTIMQSSGSNTSIAYHNVFPLIVNIREVELKGAPHGMADADAVPPALISEFH
jgi:hypothetical protein